jgi:hypothetical protein
MAARIFVFFAAWVLAPAALWALTLWAVFC